MKQLAIISGKGGTGKTTLAGAFACLAKNKIMADCDVDAADLHLLLSPKILEEHDFFGMEKAFIKKDICISCGKCREICRFNAIGKTYIVDKISCEGCAFCAKICPEKAVEMKKNQAGKWFVSETKFGLLVHAKLGIAEENSGKLVSVVRGKAKELAQEKGVDLVIVDGPPGIGCPVMASLSEIDFAVVVTEPTFSGLHDAKRVISAARHFKVEVGLLVNKSDLNPEITGKMKSYAKESNISFLGEIPFDKDVINALIAGKNVVETGNSPAAGRIREIWKTVKDRIYDGDA